MHFWWFGEVFAIIVWGAAVGCLFKQSNVNIWKPRCGEGQLWSWRYHGVSVFSIRIVGSHLELGIEMSNHKDCSYWIYRVQVSRRIALAGRFVFLIWDEQLQKGQQFGVPRSHLGTSRLFAISDMSSQDIGHLGHFGPPICFSTPFQNHGFRWRFSLRPIHWLPLDT